MKINFEKGSGLVPAVIQDARTGVVLMLGYMDAEALESTRSSGRVTFFSRSRNTQWTKGETSGHFLAVRDILVDCDGDTLLVKAEPTGPVCHTGTDSCWAEANVRRPSTFLDELEQVIVRRAEHGSEQSYTRSLLDGGSAAAGQKVGEEAVEMVIAALQEDDDRLIDEAADLMYHFLVLLRTRNRSLADVAKRLDLRHRTP